MKQFLIILLGLAFSSLAQADRQASGEYDVHYTAFSSLLIPAEVAQAHDIVRSQSRLVLNVSVVKEGRSIPVGVTGQVSNLLNQLTQLEFIEVVEPGAVYYLATTITAERDTLRYQLQIQLPDQAEPIAVRYTYTY